MLRTYLSFKNNEVKLSNTRLQPPRWRRGRAFASHAGDHGAIPGRGRPK